MEKSFLLGKLCQVWCEPGSSDHSSSNMRSPMLQDSSFSNSLPASHEGSSEFLQGASATAFGFSLIPRLAAFVLFRDSAAIPFITFCKALEAHQCPCPQRLSGSSWGLFSLPCHLWTTSKTPILISFNHYKILWPNPAPQVCIPGDYSKMLAFAHHTFGWWNLQAASKSPQIHLAHLFPPRNLC